MEKITYGKNTITTALLWKFMIWNSKKVSCIGRKSALVMQDLAWNNDECSLEVQSTSNYFSRKYTYASINTCELPRLRFPGSEYLPQKVSHKSEIKAKRHAKDDESRRIVDDVDNPPGFGYASASKPKECLLYESYCLQYNLLLVAIQ